MRSAVAGAVYFTNCRAGAGAGCDNSCVRKADAGVECGEFIFHGCGCGCGCGDCFRYINRQQSSIVGAHFKSFL